MDLAYLFGGLTDLRSLGKGTAIVKGAEVYFGADLVSQQFVACSTPLLRKATMMD